MTVAPARMLRQASVVGRRRAVTGLGDAVARTVTNVRVHRGPGKGSTAERAEQGGPWRNRPVAL